MKRFKRCFDRGKHDWQIEYEFNYIDAVILNLTCKDCPAIITIKEEDISIDGEVSSDIIANQEQDYLIAENDSRTQSGLN